jgi:hypothetical protein
MVPTPEVWNPLRPIQDNWPKIEKVQGKYSSLLGGLGVLFGFVASLALIVEHNFKLPKWPFTKDRWFPKPTEVKEQEGKETEEVTEEDLIEDELAEVAAGGLKKRGFEEGKGHRIVSNGRGNAFTKRYVHMAKGTGLIAETL